MLEFLFEAVRMSPNWGQLVFGKFHVLADTFDSFDTDWSYLNSDVSRSATANTTHSLTPFPPSASSFVATSNLHLCEWITVWSLWPATPYRATANRGGPPVYISSSTCSDFLRGNPNYCLPSMAACLAVYKNNSSIYRPPSTAVCLAWYEDGRAI